MVGLRLSAGGVVWQHGVPVCAQGLAGPTFESPPEIGDIRKTQDGGDIVMVQIPGMQVVNRQCLTYLVEQIAVRGIFSLSLIHI